MDLMSLFLFFFLGFSVAEIIRRMPREDDEEEYTDALPPGEHIPQLPPGPDYMLGDGSPYRTPDAIIVAEEPRIQLPAWMSFQDFVSYWQIVGLPENPREDRDFAALAHRIRFGKSKKLAAWLQLEVAQRLSSTECACDFIHDQVFSQCLIQSLAIRSSARDADLLSQCVDKVSWSELKYVLVVAMAGVWPVTPPTIRIMSQMTEWRRLIDAHGTESINRCSREALDKWREDDPVRFSALTQRML